MTLETIRVRKLNGWSIYRKDDLKLATLKAQLLFGTGPAEDWVMDWPELFDTTEFSMDDAIDIGLLNNDWNGHDAGAVAVFNETRNEIAIHDSRQPTMMVSERA